MIKILKVNIKNFQSHKDSEVNFDNFTVISGPTDNGKSAIIRAIKWCLYNVPDGTNFIRHGEDIASVTVHFNNKGSVTRVRGKKENYYILTNEKGEELRLENFDRGPVSEVVNFHKMYEVDFFGRKQALNICDQLSAPFFLSNSPIERAQMIGQIGNTEVIDYAISDTLSEVREQKSLLKVYKQNLSEVDSELQNYSNLHQMKEDVVKIKSINESILKLNFHLNTIKANKNNLISLYDNKKKYEEILKSEEDVNAGLETINNSLDEYRKHQNIKRNNTLLTHNTGRKGKLEETINMAPYLELIMSEIELITQNKFESNILKDLKHKLKDGIEARDEIQKIIKGKEDIEKSIEELSSCREKLSDLININYKGEAFKKSIERKLKGKKVIDETESEHSEAVNKYKEKLLENPHCPVCMSKIDKEKINKIKKIV